MTMSEKFSEYFEVVIDLINYRAYRDAMDIRTVGELVEATVSYTDIMRLCGDSVTDYRVRQLRDALRNNDIIEKRDNGHYYFNRSNEVYQVMVIQYAQSMNVSIDKLETAFNKLEVTLS